MSRLHLLPTAISLSALLLAGCGSQIDGLETPVVRPTVSAPAGIYQGEFTSSTASQSQTVTAFIGEPDLSSRRFFLFDAEGDLISGGLYTTNQSGITWESRGFFRQPATEAAPNGSVLRRIITGVGSFTPDVRILTNYTAVDEDSGQPADIGMLQLDYLRSQHLRRSDLPLLAGLWVNEDRFGSATLTLQIDQGGSLFGQNGTCTLSGELTLINQRFNLYGAGLRTQCPGDNGAPLVEAGLAALLCTPTGIDQLVIVGTSARSATLLQLQRRDGQSSACTTPSRRP